MILKDLIDGFFRYRSRQLAKTTVTNYRYAFRRLGEYFGEDRSFPSITSLDVDDYIVFLHGDGLSDRSVSDNFSICSALWTFAAEEFKFPNIIKEVGRPTFAEKEVLPFTEQEVRSILNNAEWTRVWSTVKGKTVRSHRPTWQRDVALIVLLLDTGMRVSEAAGLTIGNYDKDSGRLMIKHGKGNKERSVFLGDTGQRTLWRYLISRSRIKPADPIFVTRKKKPLHRAYIFHLFQRIGQTAGVTNVHPHRFRHTFAIQFLRNGGNIYELQRILGHEDLETVKIYLHLSEVDVQRAQRANSPADNWEL